MSRQDRLSIMITFAVGFFAGGYLYLVGFAPTFKLPEVTTENIYTEFVITAESYGACEATNSCLSFQVVENGSYRALFDNPTGGETVVKEGSIPRSVRRELREALTKEVLLEDTRTWAIPDCKYGVDGTNYRFRVTLDMVNYEIDTCESVVNYEGAGWQSLAKLWNYFTTLKL